MSVSVLNSLGPQSYCQCQTFHQRFFGKHNISSPSISNYQALEHKILHGTETKIGHNDVKIDGKGSLQMSRFVRKGLCEIMFEQAYTENETSNRWFESSTTEKFLYSNVNTGIEIGKDENSWSYLGPALELVKS